MIDWRSHPFVVAALAMGPTAMWSCARASPAPTSKSLSRPSVNAAGDDAGEGLAPRKSAASAGPLASTSPSQPSNQPSKRTLAPEPGAAAARARGAPPEPPRLAPLERACNGKDDDGDGHTDLLLPTAANACVTAAKGACGGGWTECTAGKAVCRTPPSTAEVVDGVDNDCNGFVDDVVVASKRTRSRALVFGPAGVWADATSDIATFTTVLEQAGVAFDVQAPDAGWPAKLDALLRYSLLIVPGYLESSTLDSATLAALEAFASEGGVVFIMKPMGGAEGKSALTLTGVKAASRAKTTTTLRVVETSAAAMASIDSHEERLIPLTENSTTAPMDVWTFEVAGKTQVVAEALASGRRLGAVATRRAVGRGAVYAWGHDLFTFDVSRCYMNCFEPSGDVLRLLLRDALREGSAGHVVLKHPMPGPQASTLLLTHDVRARDSMTTGAWGAPGALQMAAMEKRNDVRATYNFVTDYVSGDFKPEIVKKLCADGFCPPGALSVRHPANFRQLLLGDCAEQPERYGATAPATLCGEVRGSLDVLAKLAGERPRAWRSPYLATPTTLFDVLADNGVTLDSSFGIGDLKYNLPVDTARTPKLQRLFHQRALFEFPIAGEDVRPIEKDGREELNAKNVAWFTNAWEYIVLQNARNQSITTLRVNPTRGDGATDDSLGVKVGAVEHLVKVAKAHRIAVDSLVHFGDFWRARSKVTFNGSFDRMAGYTVSVQIGDEAIQDLTFQLGDEIAWVDCAGCGTIDIEGKHVVLRDRLAAKARITFTAQPRVVAPANAVGRPSPRTAPTSDAGAEPRR